MKRYFISQHPRFGRGTADIEGIENSHYFWWWYALSKSEKYNDASNSFGKERRNEETKLFNLFNDFGYVGWKNGESRHFAFKRWWNTKTITGEKLGEYLFAEKLTGTKVNVIETIEDFQNSKSAGDIVISIPRHIQRARIDNYIESILKKNFTFERGKVARSPKKSTARYSLSKTFNTSVMKLSFACLEERENAEARGYKITNNEIAEKVGLKVHTRLSNEEIDEYEQHRTLAIKVSRYIKDAKQAIQKAENGTFG